MSDSSEDSTSTKGGWKSSGTTHGVRYAMISGTGENPFQLCTPPLIIILHFNRPRFRFLSFLILPSSLCSIFSNNVLFCHTLLLINNNLPMFLYMIVFI